MILVVGDNCSDVFVYGDCSRMCPEAPVPVFNPLPLEEVHNDGMAGNVVRNIEALGEEVLFIKPSDTPIKTRYIDKKTNQMLLRVDICDSRKRITKKQIKHIKQMNKHTNAVIISDYDKGFLFEEDIEDIVSAFEYSFMDTKKLLGSWANGVTFIKLNNTEYNKTYHTLDSIKNIEKKLIITLGDEGCCYEGKAYPVTEKIQTMDVSGAGDTFHAAFTVKYMQTKNIDAAIQYAQECTNIVIKKKGVATV